MFHIYSREQQSSKILGINFIIFLDNAGGNNFTNSDISSLITIFIWLRDKYRYNDPHSDPISGVVESTSKYVDFILEGIYFYKSSTLNTSTDGGSMIQYLQLNDPSKLKYLNIYFTEGGSGWAHSTRGALYNSNSNLTMISIFPNPIINIANIHTNIENAHITLFDNLCRFITVEKQTKIQILIYPHSPTEFV